MTEILYILEGSATLITGGTIPDARPPSRPGGNYTGTRIEGGSSRHVVPGDVIITPGRPPTSGEHRERHEVPGVQAGSGRDAATDAAPGIHGAVDQNLSGVPDQR